MPTLFNGANSDSEEELKINTDYAKNYDNWRQKEELNKLKTKYGNINESGTSDEGSDSDSSSEDEEENELTEQFDKDFYKTLALLKKKDPKIYNQNVTFFDETKKAQEERTERKSQKPTEKSKKDEAVFLRDYERKIIVERDGKFSDSEDESALQKSKEEFGKITYVQEQKRLKDSFKSALNEEEEDETDLLKPKAKSESEKQEEEANYREWLKGQESNINEKEQETLKPLRDFWSNPGLDEGEKFLRDYILNNKYLDNGYSGADIDVSHLVHDSDENLSEDERNIEKQEEFEHKYNFRFEEPDQEFIKRYPRTMENSLRRKDTRRAQKRVEVKKRKDEEKLKKQEELKQLKALKRKEIEEKIGRLKEITGNEDIKFSDIDLDGDFDPAEYDRKMTEIFNDDYYAAAEDDVKPEFPDVDEELEVEDTWDNYDRNAETCANGEGYETHCEDAEFNMDADYDPAKSAQGEIEGTKSRKRRRKSKFAELMAKEKPKFDPEKYKSYEEYFDKYYALDYEDMIGDIPCRFKYRKVVPNDFGLSVEEILMADDKELNKWCSLKKALQYKPEHAELNDVRMYKQKAKNERLKKTVLRSLYSNPEEEENETEKSSDPPAVVAGSTETKRKRRKKQKKHETEVGVEVSGDKEAEISEKKTKGSVESRKPKIGKRKQVEETDEPSGKKKKVISTEESSSIASGSHTVKETVDQPSKDGSTMRKDELGHGESKLKRSNRKVREKVQKLKKMKGKGAKKETKSDIASLNPERLKMYGINPKKLKNKLKYGKKQQ